MGHKETFVVVILTVIASSLVLGISSSGLYQSFFIPAVTFHSSSSSSLHSTLVFAQSTDEPVLRFSDEIANPVFNLPGFTAEVVTEGLMLPTTMAFLSQNDILVLEKDKGTVRRVIDGELQPQPLLDVNVATEVERCMCGIAISQNNETGKTEVFLYYTEAEGQDGGTPIANRLYKYELVSDGSDGGGINKSTNSTAMSVRLTNPQILLDLPVLPGPRHNGGAITIGPDNNIYIPIGDTDKMEDETEAQNEPDFPADGTSGILRVTQDGEPVIDSSTGEYILGNSYPLNLYYAYGIRNSFGIDFDPVTGNLWDSENGPGHSDEINLVEPGFNSGWNQVMGIWLRGGGDPREGESTLASEQPEGLVNFGGRGQYHSPQLTWLYTIGPTAIKFLDSDKYGANYENDLFVGDIHAGNMYHFKLNQDRTELALVEPLNDKIADTEEETVTDTVLFATGFAGISDIEVSPYDGYMYVVSLGQGKIFRILPTGQGDTSASTVPPSAVPAEGVPPILENEDQTDIEGQDLPEQDEEENEAGEGNDENQESENDEDDDEQE
ncbi:MAG: PQQ-dependent sugar dehydrogenase [Nitrososphaeraceae archaeon]